MIKKIRIQGFAIDNFNGKIKNGITLEKMNLVTNYVHGKEHFIYLEGGTNI